MERTEVILFKLDSDEAKNAALNLAIAQYLDEGCRFCDVPYPPPDGTERAAEVARRIGLTFAGNVEGKHMDRRSCHGACWNVHGHKGITR